MNNRIFEIARQVPGWVSTDDNNYIGPIPSALTQFADLIIKECMDLVKDCYLDSYQEGKLTACAATIIEEHFEDDSEDQTCPVCGDIWSGTSDLS
jgi:hypothetical protein